MTSTLTRTESLPVRKGAHVLSYMSDTLGVGTIEGLSFLPPMSWAPGACEKGYVVRWADGTVNVWDAFTGVLVAVDADTVLVEDQFNNVNRLCNVRGDRNEGRPVRCWQVVTAVSGSRYLVRLRHGRTDAMRFTDDVVRLVDYRDMTNLY